MRYTRNYLADETICAICGAPVKYGEKCCNTAPYISFDEFCKRYFPDSSNDPANENYLPHRTAKEFHQDYLLSECKSLDQYIAETTSNLPY